MAKGPKFRVSILNSLQMCRPKDPSSLIKSPVPKAKHRVFSPINSKSFDISIPSSPIPPPSPNTPLSRRSAVSSKISPLGCECYSKSCKVHAILSELDDEFSSLIYSKSRKEEKGKMHRNFSVSSDYDDELAWSNYAPSRIEKTKINKSKASSSTSGSSADSEESRSLFSSSSSSFVSSKDRFNHTLKTIAEEEQLNGSKKSMKQRNARTRRFTRFGSKDWKDGIISSPEREEKPVPGTVNQSFVVVKKSVDPYKDFKKSMLEMILDKQIFEPKELEQLLMSFLSLNSRLHHKVIIEAFTEIWKEVFCG